MTKPNKKSIQSLSCYLYKAQRREIKQNNMWNALLLCENCYYWNEIERGRERERERAPLALPRPCYFIAQRLIVLARLPSVAPIEEWTNNIRNGISSLFPIHELPFTHRHIATGISNLANQNESKFQWKNQLFSSIYPIILSDAPATRLDSFNTCNRFVSIRGLRHFQSIRLIYDRK